MKRDPRERISPQEQKRQFERPIIHPEREPVEQPEERRKRDMRERRRAEGEYPVRPIPPVKRVPRPLTPKTELRRSIERILSEELAEIYRGMDEEHRAAFQQKGEEVSRAIEELVRTAKATAKKIIQLIREWLKLIPGVNKYFLEQETKIKADKILALTNRKQEF